MSYIVHCRSGKYDKEKNETEKIKVKVALGPQENHTTGTIGCCLSKKQLAILLTTGLQAMTGGDGDECDCDGDGDVDGD